MEAVIGSISYSIKQILHGDHHFLSTGKFKADNGELSAGLVVCKDKDGVLVGQAKTTADLTGTVDGSNAAFTQVAGSIDEILPGSVHISHVTGDQHIYDDGHGNLYGDGSGTINYKNGAIAVSFDTAPANATAQPTVETEKVPDSVLVEKIDTAAVDSGGICVHGPVRKSKLVDASGAAISAATESYLRKIGIIAV